MSEGELFCNQIKPNKIEIPPAKPINLLTNFSLSLLVEFDSKYVKRFITNIVPKRYEIK